ncbi:hypothetical protein ABVN80_03095 [Acinetobacter baumannii]
MPVDIVLNPLGVPSRMNVGQILERLTWVWRLKGLVTKSKNVERTTYSFRTARILDKIYNKVGGEQEDLDSLTDEENSSACR